MSAPRPWAALVSRAVPGLGHLLAGRLADAAFVWVDLALVICALMVVPQRLRATTIAVGDPVWPVWLALFAAGVALAAIGADAWRTGGRPIGRASPATRAVARFAGDRWGRLGLHLVLTFTLIALLAPLLAPHGPNVVGLASANQPPSAGFWMGTDEVGRDVMSRLLYGARISLPVALFAVAVAVLLGTAVGATAGYLGGWVDRMALWVIDLMMALPRLVLLLAVVAAVGRAEEGRLLLVAVVLGLTGWMPVARVVRADVLSLRDRDFVMAARSLGMPTWRIVARHVVPNALTPVIVNAALMVGSTILLEAALSFLGLGVPLPAPSWGGMVGAGMHRLGSWWLAVFPGLAIALTVLGFNLLADGLRTALDPREDSTRA